MAPYEALYGRPCRASIGWYEPRETRLLGTDLVRDASEKVKLIQDRLRTVHSRQNSYANWRARDVAFMKYYGDPSHVLDFNSIQLDKDLTYVEELVTILDSWCVGAAVIPNEVTSSHLGHHFRKKFIAFEKVLVGWSASQMRWGPGLGRLAFAII
uniref:Uncharacterized protein LOC104233595 n=1 Tax=Nicotiana sylvestris TaxID=4096 RepID=A0A1U7WZI7_NICSY|nr:PREDICTED: uncharacterized protein LOC104233595 [Nicotiana sylvestris]